jgi:hypothetical protein
VVLTFHTGSVNAPPPLHQLAKRLMCMLHRQTIIYRSYADSWFQSVSAHRPQYRPVRCLACAKHLTCEYDSFVSVMLPLMPRSMNLILQTITLEVMAEVAGFQALFFGSGKFD